MVECYAWYCTRMPFSNLQKYLSVSLPQTRMLDQVCRPDEKAGKTDWSSVCRNLGSNLEEHLSQLPKQKDLTLAYGRKAA